MATVNGGPVRNLLALGTMRVGGGPGIFDTVSSMPLATFACCTLLLAFAGCGDRNGSSDPAAAAFTVRDSAGVEVVENHRPALADEASWRVEPTSLLRIGRQQGDAAHQFSDIAGAVALADGRLAVADAGSGEVRFFDETGAVERIVGRRGQGPGEFSTLAGLGRGPDGRLWAYDFALRRITWIDPADGSIEIVTLGPEPPALAAVGALPGGRFVLRQLWGVSTVAGADRTGVRRDSAAVVVFGTESARPALIGAFPGREVVISLEDGRAVMTRRPFGADLMAVTRDSLVVVSEQDEPRLREYSATGELRRTSILPGPGDRTLHASDIEDYVEASLDGVPPEDRPAGRSDIEALPFPEQKPVFGRLLTDAAGNVWVGEWTRDEETARRWRVVDPRGVWLTDVTLPAGFRLLSVASDRLVGVERDALDTEYVVEYGLLRGTGMIPANRASKR